MLDYMGLKPGTAMKHVKIDRVFIGSCTNGRIEDFREVARTRSKGKKVAPHVGAMIVPGSGLVKEQAEQEGLDKSSLEAGFEWREPGCSMCLAMNADKLEPGTLRLHLEPQLRRQAQRQRARIAPRLHAATLHLMVQAAWPSGPGLGLGLRQLIQAGRHRRHRRVVERARCPRSKARTR